MIPTNGRDSKEPKLSSKEGRAYFESLPGGWKVSRNTWRQWIADGTLTAYRPGPRKQVRIDPRDIRELASRKAKEE